uniref:Uncharacterized protein n=1 Tax=Cannabis sativa TaxID=3483 RepID=A0A803Q734_CANSA
MTFLKQAPVLNRKPKTRTATTSPIVPQKRKSDVVATPVADSSMKQITQLQERNKKLKQDANSKDKDLENLQKSKEQVELQAKLSQSKVEELSRDFKTEEENGKKQYDQAIFDYIYTTFSKVPDFDFSILGAEAAEMAEAFRVMSPTQTQGCGGNLFPKEA